MDITLKQLQIFRAVVVAGSITKASKRLVLSQPSISQQLAKLEERLGAQLILRNRTGLINLTPAGEYWFNVGDELLQRLDTVTAEYHSRFVGNSVTLRLGITPTMRGRFIAKAARIASEEPGFAKFEVRYALTSNELVQQLNLHQLNCGLVTAESIANESASFAMTEVFDNAIALVVPAEVTATDIANAMAAPEREPRGALGRFIEVDAGIPLRQVTEHWYRHNLPGARPTFTATTYAAAVEVCAEGLASTHCPLSLLPNLPASTLERLRFFRIEGIGHKMVLAMPKHLLTLPPYARIYRRIADFCRTEYVHEMHAKDVPLVPTKPSVKRPPISLVAG
jgi:DNA-binding transcriptional LysR family regulator